MKRPRIQRLALLALAACGTIPLAAPPPLGVSLADPAPAEADAPRSEAGPLRVERALDCDVPAYLPNDAAGPRAFDDIVYAQGDPRQKYDLALPDVGAPKALVVLIHGGGWTSGNRKLFRPTIRTLATLGYAAASVGYRLASSEEHAFPVALADVRCAIRAVASRVSAPKTIVLGASAGGHLAAMAALNQDAPQFDDGCADRRPLRIDGAILYYPPLAIDRARERYVPIMRQAVDELLFGVRRVADVRRDGSQGALEDGGDWLARAQAATPERFVRPGAPPMLLLQGDDDTIVPPQDARDFAAALERAQVPHLLVELPNEKHGFPVLGRGAALKPASCTVLRFLSQIASL